MMIKHYNFPDMAECVEKLAARIVEHIARSLILNQKAVLCLSGGSTPRKLYQKLQLMNIDWSTTIIMQVDERAAPIHSDKSNNTFIRNHLGISTDQLITMYFPDIPLDECAERYHESFMKYSPPDIALLGMGEDGHTASLFPTDPMIQQWIDSSRFCVATYPPKQLPRLSLTPKAILSAKEIVILISGKKKKRVLERALAGTNVAEMPVRAILHQTRTPVNIYYTDNA